MTSTRLSRLDTMDDLLLYRLSLVAGRAGSMVVRLCEGQYGITRREWRFLGQLAMQDRLAPSVLAQRAHLDKARTSRAIASMVEKGLVERRVDAADRRQAEVTLTDAGRALYAQLMPLVRRLNHDLLEALTGDEVTLLDGLLDRLQRRAEAMVHEHHAELPKTMRHKGGRERAPRA